MKHTKKVKTNEAQSACAIKWNTICNCKQQKEIIHLQRNEEHYVTANKMKYPMQMQTNESHYVTANNLRTLRNCKNEAHYATANK